MQSLDARRLQCIYGDQAKDALGPELGARGVQVVTRPGGIISTMIRWRWPGC
ncbi:AcvB/VirJ family lysyl-phosphatidylglycerol hydrolase [Xanthomonas arboricola]|uniref:AcvB/VirJ family lysyl-phosphatidylglycerol hydrolase n=1 Tax=Xanthomonas arboricola TaxID=56448 RepID=UPI000CEEE9B4|nr:hypothetical protein XaplCFBP3123_08220 [Xanthomonas arboricola pv. populi]